MNTRHIGNVHFLYDVTLIDDVADGALFEHGDEMTSGNQSMGSQSTKTTAQGRGSAVFFRYKNLRLVYKHYQRGGFLARFLHDRYIGIRLDGTRAFREWNLLHQLRLMGLPSPVPVAARIIRSGLFYRADMVMMEIEDTATLADLCLKSDVGEDVWCNVGRCIKRFHAKDVYHADLNARNILVGEEGDIYLVDFDKGGFRVMSDSWKASNLSRLKRSLMKFKNSNPVFHYTSNNWRQLLSGYNQSG